MHLAYANLPPKLVSQTSLILALLLATGVAAMVSCQLMTFEKFIPIIQSFALPGGSSTGRLMVALIVAGEILSLPFLLRMNLSPLFRLFSAILCASTPLLWSIIIIWAYSSEATTAGTGFFGSLIKAQLGLWSLVYCLGWLAASIGIVWLLRADLRMKQYRKVRG